MTETSVKPHTEMKSGMPVSPLAERWAGKPVGPGAAGGTSASARDAASAAVLLAPPESPDGEAPAGASAAARTGARRQERYTAPLDARRGCSEAEEAACERSRL